MATATHHKIHKARMHLRAAKKRPKGNVKGDINVTPLVDVVLVLLIIFMVVTPMIASGVAVDLPKTANHSKKPDDGKDIIVALTKEKEIYVGSKKLSLTELPKFLDDERRRSPEKTIFVKADTRTTWGAARGLMEVLNKTGIENVVLGTEEIRDNNAGGAK